jgi:hypothetical protein
MNSREGDSVMYISNASTTIISCMDLGPSRTETIQKLIDTLEKRDDFMFNYNMFSSLGAIGLSDGVYVHTWMTCTFMCENIDNMIDEWKDAHLIHKRLTCTFMCDSI